MAARARAGPSGDYTMGNEFSALAREVLAYCKDAEKLDACASWSDVDDWLAGSATEAWHDYENSLALQAALGTELATVKDRLLIDYMAKNIARRLVSLRNLEETDDLHRRRANGLLDEEAYASESRELAKAHARMYERLGL
jgi:hypothetical protein